MEQSWYVLIKLLVQLENSQKTEAGSIAKPRNHIKLKFGAKMIETEMSKNKFSFWLCSKNVFSLKTEKVSSMCMYAMKCKNGSFRFLVYCCL